jgi:thiamine-monophosphate kinase
LRGVATAAIDISDGIVGDLGHLLEASGVGATLRLSALPRSPALETRLSGGERALALACLLAGGDDYELCFTAPLHMAAQIGALAEHLDLPLTRIGSVEARAGLVVLGEDGRALAALPQAFDHFRA